MPPLSRADRVKAAAQAEIEQEPTAPKKNCAARWPRCRSGCGKVLGAQIDENANRDMLDKLAAQL